MEPNRRLSWRWHPAAIDANVDYSSEPTTLVEFELKEVQGGTLLTVVESGLDACRRRRRLDAFRMNSNRAGNADEKHRKACRNTLDGAGRQSFEG